jgi:hypothetical protein
LIEEVLVHADQTWQRGLSRQVADAGASRNLHGARSADRRDLPVLDDERLIVTRRPAGAVDHARVRQRDDRRRHAHECLALALAARRGGEEGEQCNAAPEVIHAPPTMQFPGEAPSAHLLACQGPGAGPDYRFRCARTTLQLSQQKKVQSSKLKVQSESTARPTFQPTFNFTL